MGCWNHTCAITNLPIFEGEEVEVIMLQFSNIIAGSSLCYPYFYHVPLPLTFQGYYNDYGGVEDCHGVALDIIVDAIRNNLFELELGENKYHDIPAKKENFDVKNMFELDHEDRLNIVNPYRGHPGEKEKTMIKHLVVRKEVYDKLVEKMELEWWNPKTLKQMNVNLDFVMHHCHKIATDIDDMLSLDADDIRRYTRRMNGTLGSDTLAGQLLNRTGEYRGKDNPIHLMDLLVDFRDNGNIETYDAVLENALRLAIVCRYMDAARKVWVLSSGVGSQNSETTAQKLCAELTLSSAEIIDKRWDE